MAFKKVSDLVEALEISQQDLFLLSDMLGLTSKKVTFDTLSTALNTSDLNGRFEEGSEWTINRDTEGLVSSLSTVFGTVTKTFTITRNSESQVSTVNIHNSDNSYDKTYTFVRDAEGIVNSISIS